MFTAKELVLPVVSTEREVASVSGRVKKKRRSPAGWLGRYVTPRVQHSMSTGVLGKVSTGGANLTTTAVMRIRHIDSETLGGTALLHGWVRSQLALAAPCGQLPQSIGINVTVTAAWAVILSGDKQKWH
ncbi:hypothetical protein Q8A73_023090 [Channa argus]|nr:hypothetical protein Q8A73_023090 [Channa argus]